MIIEILPEEESEQDLKLQKYIKSQRENLSISEKNPSDISREEYLNVKLKEDLDAAKKKRYPTAQEILEDLE